MCATTTSFFVTLHYVCVCVCARVSFIKGGTIHTKMEGDECTAAVDWDVSFGSAANCSSGVRCDLAEAFEIVPGSVTKDSSTGQFTVNAGTVAPMGDLPADLQSRAWPDPGNKQYDRASAAALCNAPAAAEPDDAANDVDSEPKLSCRQSKAGDWMGWKWYKFVEQPSMQRLGLSDSEKCYMQERIERLHTALQPNAPVNDWLKAPADGSLPELVEVDAAQLVVPPTGLEVGYVPVVVYQGLNQHADCVEVDGGTGPTTEAPTTQAPTTKSPGIVSTVTSSASTIAVCACSTDDAHLACSLASLTLYYSYCPL